MAIYDDRCRPEVVELFQRANDCRNPRPGRSGRGMIKVSRRLDSARTRLTNFNLGFVLHDIQMQVAKDDEPKIAGHAGLLDSFPVQNGKLEPTKS